jgi:hypothetical protein
MMALLKEQNGTINRNYDSAGKKAIVLMGLLQKEYALN